VKKLLRNLRTYLAPREDPYAGGDLDNAHRIGSVLWGLLVVLTTLLLPFSPPTEPLGSSGWLIAAVLILLGAAAVYGMRTHYFTTWRALGILGVAILLGVGVMQWLGGGIGAPYERLVLLPVLFTAAIQPPRKIAVFMGLVLLVMAAPFIYDGWNSAEAGSSVVTYVVWCALAIGGNLLMSGVRMQRLALAADEAEAREEARVDALTGLYNRRAFDEILQQEVFRARRLGIPLSMAMVDVVNFKEINDRWSYAEGDRCLREIGVALREALRDPDLCFRWGGDEYAVILTGTAHEDTEQVAERLHRAVGATCERPDEEPVQIRFAASQLEEGQTSQELVERAGLALTEEKLDAR
jgi:diguanylate cyclase (GGDEF)-like protein